MFSPISCQIYDFGEQLVKNTVCIGFNDPASQGCFHELEGGACCGACERPAVLASVRGSWVCQGCTGVVGWGEGGRWVAIYLPRCSRHLISPTPHFHPPVWRCCCFTLAPPACSDQAPPPMPPRTPGSAPPLAPRSAAFWKWAPPPTRRARALSLRTVMAPSLGCVRRVCVQVGGSVREHGGGGKAHPSTHAQYSCWGRGVQRAVGLCAGP